MGLGLVVLEKGSSDPRTQHSNSRCSTSAVVLMAKIGLFPSQKCSLKMQKKIDCHK
jgi:hypothetical protein